MFKAIAIAFFALTILKPVDQMDLQELQARLVELAGEIAAGGGIPSAEQEAEMTAIQERMEAIISGAIDESESKTSDARAEAERQETLYTIPDTMPLDSIGRAIASALPSEFRNETCNADTPDVYQNLQAFYAGKDLADEPIGQLFMRRCGNDDGYNYSFSVDSTQDGRNFATNLKAMPAERQREESVEVLTLCGQTAYRSGGFQSTVVPLDDFGVLTLTEWEGEGRSTTERLAIQAEMANAVDCDAIIQAVAQ